MKLSTRLNELLNQQVAHELRNSNIYLQMSSIFEDYKLTNLASFFKKLSVEEKEHAQMFVNHLNSRTGGKVSISEIESPNVSETSFDQLGKLYVETEELTTEKIEEIMSVVRSESSYIDEPFILHMLGEQVQEEDEATIFYNRIQMVQDIVLFDATFGG